MKKHSTIGPLLTVASICLVPVALQAQTTGQSQPSAPSVPSTPSLPTTPSQPAGLPYPSNIWYPGTAGFQPAGTQASTVSDQTSPAFQLRALAAVEHESNVLRTPGGGVSDQALIAGIGARADRRYGLQRFRADIEANTYRYDRQSDLNYSVFNYALAWDWSLTPRLHGVASADRKQYREVATDPVALVNRVGKRTERNEVLEGVFEAGAALRLMAGASHTKASSTEPATWDASPSVTSARVGVGYELGSGTSLWGRYRRGDGSYGDPTPGASTGDFKENEADLLLKWPVSGKTSVEARLGHLERNHDTNTRRDFSGMVGSAGVSWDVTGKTRVIAGVSRDLSATGLATGGHVQSNRFYVGPVWKATSLIAVNARYDRVSRDWKNVPAGSAEVGRNESIEMLSAGVEWEPRRWLAVSGYVRGERQKSNLNTGYRNTTIGAAVKAYF
ncbi:outer membrane beta-barrel protein [Ramlibacter sp.]|uniref:outer membrane beta-barrel protein n=1 Tax=Ramlibacter sp. TaxID=1917967 RepID=UPI002CD2DA46|nr:outer membrane beta-barrel protein [Ramlibacter sp.]HWI82319.1 outer membrane beta-barrel protein [Ramlibacter sp.]